MICVMMTIAIRTKRAQNGTSAADKVVVTDNPTEDQNEFWMIFGWNTAEVRPSGGVLRSPFRTPNYLANSTG